jgi:hypothetical protein
MWPGLIRGMFDLTIQLLKTFEQLVLGNNVIGKATLIDFLGHINTRSISAVVKLSD